MTVPTATSRSTYTGNGVTTAFTTGFYFLAATEVVVKLTLSGGSEVVQTLGVHYTVTMPPSVGAAGTVTMLTAPAADSSLVIERTVPYTQATSFRTQGSFAPSVHEDAMDELAFQCQQLARRVSDLESAGALGSVVAGNGLSFSSTTLHVGAGNGIQANADTVEVLYGDASAIANVTKAAASAGVANTAARSDHKHNITTAAPGTIAVGDSAAEGSATSLARSDHTHALTAPSAPANVTKAAASAGVATTVARSDHKHDISTAAAADITDSTNAEGVATTLARSDHSHSHGNRGGGSLHTNAVSGGAAGFMSGTDKATLDRLAALARVRANANSAQTFVAGAGSTVMQYNDDSSLATHFYDSQSNYDPTTYRFTAPRTGYYHVSGTIRCSKSGGGAWTAGDALAISVEKNGGTLLWEGASFKAWAALSASAEVNWATTIILTAGDYIEAKANASGASNFVVSKGYLQVDELP